MPSIHVLSPQTANLIAAGEVVERPANAVKELLENAIDAGGTRIGVEIRGGGTELISVSDNGCGMEKDDLPLAVRRHATSKIRDEKDLTAIGTLGFRGEALAAISAASRFTLLSKRAGETFGWQMTVEGETVTGPEECGCGDGTTVLVRDLFFNQPARRKFLKSARTEGAAILQYIQRIAVSHPEIAFQFVSDGEVKLQTTGNGRLDECIYAVYGKEFASSVTPLYETTAPYCLSGFVTRPEFARNNHNYQSFYINGRFVKSRTLQFALEDAYKSFVKSEKFPGCVIFLKVDPERVDVNVHPAKLEVRFEDERSVYGALYHAVRRTLENLSNRLAREEFEKETRAEREAHPIREPEPFRPQKPVGEVGLRAFDTPMFSKAEPKTPYPGLFDAMRDPMPLRPRADISVLREETEVQTKAPIPGSPVKKGPGPLEAAAGSPAAEPEEAPEQLVLPDAAPAEKKDNPLTLSGRIRGILFDAFILYETGEAVYVIDKHAAHERILYEGLKKDHSPDQVQMLLEPLVFSFDAPSYAALADHREDLAAAGFELAEFGTDSFALRSVPLVFSGLSGEDLKGLLQKTARELLLGGRAAGVRDKAFDRVLFSMACKAAVKAGIPTTEDQHEWIVKKLREIDNVTVCPHGRPVLVRFTKKHMEDLFLRD